jgi:hypothetical protein
MGGRISYSKIKAGTGRLAFGFCKLEIGINSAVAAPHKNDRQTHRNTQW